MHKPGEGREGKQEEAEGNYIFIDLLNYNRAYVGKKIAYIEAVIYYVSRAKYIRKR